MNEITRNPAVTMSSREIAVLVESRHDTVKLAMDRLRDRGLITFTALAEKSSGGRPGVIYCVGKRDSYVIVAQLSPEFTARLVDRWQQLESQFSSTAPAVPQTFADALRLAADQAERIESQRLQLEEQKPAVEFAHAVRNTSDAITVGDMARVLGIGQNRFFRQLRTDQILMAENRPYQNYIDRGYFRVVENVWIDAAKEPHPTFKTLVTGRGQVYLQRKYGQQSEQAA